MGQKPAAGISNTQFNLERQRIVEDLVRRMETLTSLTIITVDDEGADRIEVLGDLCLLQQLAALTTQQISAEINVVSNAH